MADSHPESMRDLAVLITAYNDREGLHKVLQSIREPDYAFTVVIVDDGSDEPVSLTESSYPFSVKLITLPENLGTARASNVGLDWIRSRGFDIVARLDAGDRQRPNRLSIQYHHLKKNPDLVLLGSNAVFRSEINDKTILQTDLPRSWDAIKKRCIFQNCFIHPTVMVRLDQPGEMLRYSERYPFIDDYVLYKEIAQAFPSEVLSEPLVDCYVRKSGLSVKHNREQLVSGIKHHLDHPEILNVLWYAYISKKIIYLLLPYGLRTGIKKWLLKAKQLRNTPSAVPMTREMVAEGAHDVQNDT